ncbi:serine/threonine protein kinase [Candidatus Magnetobacterium bavaricum]|uniref:Serine/threonine protein kinase n=1 Tax=Candidatus Magnetobacterium bavaricum TaxID=29290 RepID=A0A0F3GUX9_9BACT|nr:serine/threonine protein kinase [Candidatus Magnetobacterium bavaricum]
MPSLESLCYGCFSEKGNQPVCRHCGYEDGKKLGPLVIKPGNLLAKNKYAVGRVLGKPGGFGITYIGWDTVLETKVAIKEFLPRDCAGRDTHSLTVVPHSREEQDVFQDGLVKFLEEARTLARFDHANIIRIRDFFEENATGYLVMDYCDGINLDEYLKSKGGRLSEKSTVAIMMPILDGLREVHANSFLHRDIKPLNILITRNKLPVLLDFGAARAAIREKSRSLTVVLTPGFAPYEQYQTHGKQGPWTDIYACGATMYYMISGHVPPDAIDRKNGTVKIAPLMKLAPDISKKTNEAIMLALSIDPQNRPATVKDFQKLLPITVAGTIPATEDYPVPPRPVRPTPVKNDNDDLKVCPLCAENVKRLAKKCHYCGHYFDKNFQQEMVQEPPSVDKLISSAYISFFAGLFLCGPIGSLLAIYYANKALKVIEDYPSYTSKKGTANTAFWLGVVLTCIYLLLLFIYLVK